jgi:pimeloyl-ACP methyl ester carboxylesterase
MAATRRIPDGHLAWRQVLVDGRSAVYGVAGGGAGPCVVFLHGWALTHRAYRRALKRLVQQEMRVIAPALPGFGGTAKLPRGEVTLAGYGQWVDGFLEAIGIDEPVTLIGHSFGGGVAIQTAHDWPNRVSHLVVVNSIGGSVWSSSKGATRAMRDRPLWDWGLHMHADVLGVRQIRRVLPVVVEDAAGNLVRNPRAIWYVANLARTADLTRELEELKRRRLPVVILWGQGDTVIPRASVESMRQAVGSPNVITVPGNHSWLLSDPDMFGEVITNVVRVAELGAAS